MPSHVGPWCKANSVPPKWSNQFDIGTTSWPCSCGSWRSTGATNTLPAPLWTHFSVRLGADEGPREGEGSLGGVGEGDGAASLLRAVLLALLLVLLCAVLLLALSSVISSCKELIVSAILSIWRRRKLSFSS